jgi:hypothetical protein
VIALLVVLAGGLAARGALWYQTTDFFCLYHGAHSLVIGVDPYNEAAWQAATGGLYPDPHGGVAHAPCPGRYGYPLWTAVALLPLGALPIELASTLWMALSIGAVLVGIVAAWSAFGGTSRYAGIFAVCVVMSQPFWILLISGQVSGVTLGLAGFVAWAIARGHERTGGIALALLALKPQTSAVAIPAAFLQAIVQGRPRFAIPAFVTGALMLVIPLLFVPTWPVEWLGEIFGRRLRVASLLPTAWGLAADTVGDARWGAALLVAVVIATVVIARRRADPLLVFVLSLPISLFATPYAWTYDFLVLAVAWGFIFACAERSRGTARATLVVAGLVLAVFAPWALYAVSFTRGQEALSATLSAATALVAAAAARTQVLGFRTLRST